MMEISKRIKIIISTVFILAFIAASFVSAESIWEGSAAMGRYGEFPFTGYYGASNSFPQNAFVEVENLENGKRTRLIVVDRISDSGLLMLVSNEAAQELGIYQNDVARINVRVLSSGNTVKTPQIDDLAYNPDPDMNPAAALMTTDELMFKDLTDNEADVEPEAEVLSPEVVEVEAPAVEATEAEVPEAEVVIAAASEPEKVLETEVPPENEILAEDVEFIPAPEEILKPVTLAEAEIPREQPVNLENEPVDVSVPVLELLSSGIGNAEPEYSGSRDFNIGTLPELIDKDSSVEPEYITDASDYYNPLVKELEISSVEFPVPELEVSEEVIAVLVGDHLKISEAEPDVVSVDDSLYDTPQIVYADDRPESVPVLDLIDSNPVSDDGSTLVANAFPALPAGDTSTLVEASNGYITPGTADYTVDVKDFPEYAGAPEPEEVPNAEDNLAYSGAPVSDKTAELPEYDENVEISLVPAEVRPPELVEDDIVMENLYPDEAAPLETDIAKDEPEIKAEEPVEIAAVTVEKTAAEPVEEPVVVQVVKQAAEPVVEQVVKQTAEPELETPAEVMVVSKLQQQKHYLQLGAFREKNSAIKAAGKLEAVYPVTILSDETSASYKLLLGPLSADESGIMLYNFRAGGYSDAFIRRIE